MKLYWTSSTTTVVTFFVTAVGWWCQVHAEDVATPVSAPFFNILPPSFRTKPPTTPSPSGDVVTTTPPTTPSPSGDVVTTTPPTTPSPSGDNVTTTTPVPGTPSPSGDIVTTMSPTVTMSPTMFTNGAAAYDCTLAEDGIDVRGDGTLLLRHIINPINETVTVQLEYVGEAWVSFGFSTSFLMVPNVAVIGLPNENTVLKYNMSGKALTDVVALPTEQQTLMDMSIVQEAGRTILTYTQFLSEVGEVPVLPNAQNTYIWAFGIDNVYASHDPSSRGGAVTTIKECLPIGETSSPTVPPTIAPTATPVTRTPVVAPAPTEPIDGLDCSFQSPIQLDKDKKLRLSQVINQNNGTVTIQLEYDGTAWVSFGFSKTTAMVPNIAVIGLPDEQTVKKYNMIGKGLADVFELPEEEQTLMDTSITQKDGVTTLKFTQTLDDLVDVPVVKADPNTYIWAYGMGNPIGFHSPTARGGQSSMFTECLAVGETSAPIPEATESPSVSPVAGGVSAEGVGVIDLGNGRVQRTVPVVGEGIDLTFITDSVEETLTIEMVYAGMGYVSVAFSPDLKMPDSLAVMALPDDGLGVPQKYDMSGYALSDVVLAPSERQTLTDASYYQNDTHTGMIFTKKFVEGEEQEILLAGINNVLWAIGPTNAFAVHSKRGGFPIDFSSTDSGPIDTTIESQNKSWWIVHGVLLAVAWVVLVPIAIVVSILKSYLTAMPAGFWFRTHRNLNALGVIFTIVGFGISVYLIADEKGGSDAKHFSELQHHTIGLVVFLFAFIQAVSGFFRPHLPHKPDPVEEEEEDDDVQVEEGEEQVEAPVKADHHHELRKSPQRIFFEYQHRILGAVTVVLGWFNCDSGFDAYNVRFQGPELNAALWAVVSTIILVTVLMAFYDRLVRQRS